MSHSVASQKEYYRVLAAAIITGLLLSLVKVYNDNVINDDATLYLSMADAMLAGDWQYAFSLFPKPFYSILIYLVATVTGLETVTAAHTVNALLSSALVFAFLYTFYHLGASTRLLIITAVLVVFFPSILKYKSMIIRDHGFLAGLLFSVGNIFIYSRYKKTRYLVMATAALVFASLFRFEAVVFLGALPLIAYVAYQEKHVSLKKLVLLLAVLFVAGSLSLYFWLLSGSGEASILDQLLMLFKNKLQVFSNKSAAIAEYTLDKYSQDKAGIFLVSGYLAILLFSILQRVTLVYLVMAVYGYSRPSVFNQGGIRMTWLLFVGVSFATLIALLLNHYIIVGRYSLAIAALFIFPAAYGLHEYLYNRKETGNRARLTIYIIVGLFLLANAAQKLAANDRGIHIREASTWIRNNIPANAVILSNSTALLYYAGHSHMGKEKTGLFDAVDNDKPHQYRVLVEKDADNKNRAHKLVKQFRGRKSVVSVYKIAGAKQE